MEIWKDINGYEGYYQASNLGRIKSLSRTFNHPTGNGTITIKDKILSPSIEGSGYLIVSLSKKGIQKKFKVHQLIAMTFLNHIPCGHKIVVNHIDFDKKNNKVINLELVTTRENSNKKHLKSTSKYTGVSWNKRDKKWRSYIYINGKLKHLGYYESELEAHEAYQNALNNIIK